MRSHRRTLATPLLVLGLLPALLTVASGPVAAIATSNGEVLPSALAFDGKPGPPAATAQTVTLPLHAGIGPNGPVLYVVTESSDAAQATARGINYAPKLANALGSRAVQPVSTDRAGVVHFTGSVNFAPTRVVVPGPAPNYFPPVSYAPGAVGDAEYSPLTSQGDGIVVNRPQIANSTGINDSVVSINRVRRTVSLRLFAGFYEDHPVLYIRTEASNPLLAAIESSTYAPNLDTAPGLGSDDPTTSAREAIVPIVNGPTGATNPQRQGLNSALAGEGAPLNIIQEEPAPASDPSSQFYSPVWDVTPGQWTNTAITAGARSQLRSIAAVEIQAAAGALTSTGTGPTNPAVDLAAAGFVSLCPIVAILPIPQP